MRRTVSSDQCPHSDHSDHSIESKVLKCGQQIPVSRTTGAKLFINSKKISRDQGRFIIGAHSDDDVVCPPTASDASRSALNAVARFHDDPNT
jgi:hypothetical protein